MDNGLIFPYPFFRAHGESVILTHLIVRLCPAFGLVGVCDAGDLIW